MQDEPARSPSPPDTTITTDQADDLNTKAVIDPALSKLYYTTLSFLEDSANSLKYTSRNRLRRYNITRTSVLILMLIGIVITAISSNNGLGFELLLARSVPIILSFAILFYVIEAFLRDYDVALECAREAHRIENVSNNARLEWILYAADRDDGAASQIIQTMSAANPNIERLIAADRVTDIARIQSFLPCGFSWERAVQQGEAETASILGPLQARRRAREAVVNRATGRRRPGPGEGPAAAVDDPPAATGGSKGTYKSC
jgi:hypothetical protein